MKELAYGDTERVQEIKKWLKQGKKVPEIRKTLVGLGYSSYHIAILLEGATGKAYVPPKPVVIIDTTKIKFIIIVGIGVALLALGWWFFGV